MKIIYLSGIDGCGKTTQAKLLVEDLKQYGVNAEYIWLRWEPSFKKGTNAIRSIVAGFPSMRRQKSVEAEEEGIQDKHENKWAIFKRQILSNFLIRQLRLIFASADYYFSYKRRLKDISADVVVLDRYVHDFIIDQAINMDISPDRMHQLKTSFFLKKFCFPDFKIIIDLPPVEGCLRKSDGTTIGYLYARKNTINSFPVRILYTLMVWKALMLCMAKFKDGYFKNLR